MAKNKVEETFTHMFADKFNENEKFIEENLLYEVIAGSFAYGVNNEDSDYDIVSVFMDKHSDLYPQNYGFILGFDTETGRFQNKELKGEKNRIIHKGIEVEAEWRSLTRFCQLATFNGSPNIVETLFVRSQCIKYIHPAFQIIKDNASKFISMRSFHAFKGYMHSQFHRIKRNVDRGKTDNPKRQWMLDQYGYDVKMSYHIIRLIDILDQMLSGQTELDLMRNKNECKLMRDGEWGAWEDFQRITTEKLDILDNRAKKGDCKLPNQPRHSELRNILNSSIEEWYGSADGQEQKNRQYVSTDDIFDMLNNINKNVDKLANNDGSIYLGAG
jgi:uncharacterized protein